MDYRPSDRLSSHLDHASRPAAASTTHGTHYSFPRQRWTHLATCSPSAPSSDFSSQVNPCRHETALDETTRAYRTTARRQLNGNPKPLSWRSRQLAASNPGGRPSSTLVSQPVLVRSYSGGPDDPSNSSSTMPSRRSFPFIISSSASPASSSAQRRGPELPAEEEFSIDNILRAIEPNIRNTLDSIGEICGRSKLSLANEYGSHIAPLGEIRAPPGGGLLPVEEASSDMERYSGENVVVYDDENSSALDGRDQTPFSHYTFFDALLPSPSHAGRPHSVRDGSSVQVHPDTPRSLGMPDPTLGSLPLTREFASKPKSDGRALLGTPAEIDTDNRMQDILTPALVSEILLDAQANGHSDTPPPARHEQSGSRAGNLDLHDMPARWAAEKSSDVQSMFRWLRIAGWNDNPESAHLTAEMRLRAMLERAE